MSESIADFLLARIAEDEAELEAAAEAEAEALRHDGMPGTTAAEVAAYWLRPESKTRWPRVLAECKARRAIVEAVRHFWDADLELVNGGAWEDILVPLASVYADHPDFDPAWRLEPTEAELADMTVEQLNAYADTFDE